jgi:hypothetical protein
MDELDDEGTPLFLGQEAGGVARAVPPSVALESADDMAQASRCGKLLQALLAPTAGRPVTLATPRHIRVRICRSHPPGYASKTAALITAVIAAVNVRFDLGAAPMTLEDVLGFSNEGREVLARATVARDTEIMAQGLKDTLSYAGRHANWEAVGIASAARVDGRALPTALVAQLAQRSASSVQKGLARIKAGEVGTFGSQARPAGAKRVAIPPAEQVSQQSHTPVCTPPPGGYPGVDAEGVSVSLRGSLSYLLDEQVC